MEERAWDKLPNTRRSLMKVYGKTIPEVLRAPLLVYAMLTHKCNLNCIYCYLGCPRKTGELSTEEWRTFLNDARELGVPAVCFSGGEPTLREDLTELIRHTARLGLRVSIDSNGHLINADYARELKISGLGKALISLDGAEARVHESLRGQGSFEKAFRAIEALIFEGIPVTISFCCTKLNFKDFPNVVRLAEELGATKVLGIRLIPTTDEARRLAITKEESDSILKQVSEYKGKITVRFDDVIDWIKARVPNFTCAISPEGWSLPFSGSKLAFGNIRKISFKEIWEKGLSKAWRHPVFTKTSEISNELDLAEVHKMVSDYTDLLE
ncbi:MAG: radical SAM protein [Candidatus Helarchaeota archaeon]|nr:radical SAM protein [Candidatus Helarchaeota archaeon]